MRGTRLKEYLRPLAAGCAIALVVFLSSAGAAEAGLAHRLCDAFFVAGVLILGSGGLAYANYHGLFDVFNYGVRRVADTAWPWVGFLKEEDKEGNYADYRLRRQKRRSFPRGLLLAGATLMLLAACMLVLYLCLEA